MSSHRRLTARRLDLLGLETRDVPAVYICTVDPAVSPAAANAELRSYVAAASADDAADTIRLFAGGTYVFNDAAVGGSALGPLVPATAVKVTTPLITLDGNGATLRRSGVAGTPAFRFLDIRGTTDGYGRVVVNNLTLDGGASDTGGAVRVQNAPVSFDNVRILNSTASEYGGAVAFADTLTVTWQSQFTNSYFDTNTATQGGGAVALSSGGSGSFGVANSVTYAFSQSQFTNNKAASGDGGGLLARDDDFFVSGSTFSGNTAGGRGGGLFSSADLDKAAGGNNLSDAGDTVGSIINSTFDGNTANTGGGIGVDGGWLDVRIFNSTVTRNVALSSGAGGIHWQQSTANIFELSGNTSLDVRPGSKFTRVELGNTVVAENTTAGKAEFADLRGWFFNTTAAARNTLRLTGYTARPQPGNVVGVLDTGATLFNTSAAVTVAANGTSTTPLVPGLGALADHGGGLLTRVPQAGSVLIDITNTGGYTELQSLPGVATNLDERGSGFARRAGFTLDAGAVEVQNPGTFLVVPALPGQFGPPQQVTAPNSLFPQPITVSAQDEYGLPVTTQKVELQFNPVGSGVGATFPLGSKLVINPDAPATAGSGSGFVYLAARPVVGTFTQTASFGGQQLGFRLYVRPGLGSSDVIRPTLPADGSVPAQFQAVVGTDYAPLSVTVRDSSGTPLAGATVTFTVVLPAGGKGSDNPFAVPAVSASGSFTAGGDPAVVSQLATVTSDASGVATITLKAGTKAGLVTVLVSATATNTNGLLQVAANDTVTLQNLPDVASRVSPALPDADGNEQSGNGQLVRILSAPAKPLVFLVSDQYLNPRPGVTVTLNDLDTGRLAGLANDGVTAVSDADGRATFSAATGNAAVANAQVEAAPYTVRASAGELVADVQLTNVPGLPAGLAILDGNNQSAPVSDSRVAVGESNQFPSLLRVRVTDAGGNPVPAGTVISFTGVGIRFESARVPTGDDGVAEVRVAPSEQAGTFTATALADTGASATFTLTATAGLPTSVAVIAGDAQTARAGATLSPVRVQVLDQYQNPVPGVAVTVAGGGGTFTSTLTGADGRSTVTVVAGAVAGQYTASASVGSLTAGFGFTVTGIPVDLDNPPPVVGLPSLTAVGLGDGIASRVTVYNPDGSVRTQFTPFDPGFLGGTRAAVARDPRGNRVVVVPGPGRFPDARVFSADDGTEVATFQPFEVGFTGGLFVASADIDRDGYEDYVFSADVGGGPRVKITSGKTGATLQDFFGIEDTNFRGGARVAVGDVNGDGTPDLIVAAGVGGGPRVAVYDGTTVIGVRNTPRRLVGDFFAFEQALRNGAYVAAGDVDGDGKAEVVLGGGPGGGPRVRVLSGADLLNNRQTAVSDFFAGPQTDRGGVKVTVRDLSGQTGTTGAKSDLVAASGSGDGSRVTVYLGSQLRPGQPPAARGFDDLSGFRGGVFVG